jgi:MATE family multidrug resistance protein
MLPPGYPGPDFFSDISCKRVDLERSMEQSQQAAQLKHPLIEMAQVAAPTVVTMTSYTVMQFIDAQMVSRIGPDEVYVAAQGNGGMAVWFAMSFALGLITVINTFVSQNLGADTAEQGAKYAWSGLWIVAVCGLLMLPYGLSLPWIFGAAMQHQGKLLEMEIGYGQILIYGAVLTMSARTIAQFFYGMHRPMIVMVAVLAGNLTNVFANAILIFGAAGLPVSAADRGFFANLLGPIAAPCAAVAKLLGVQAWDVSGAALGTIIGTGVELLIPLLVFLGPRMHARYRTRSAWRPAVGPIRDILRIGWPGGVMFANEMICWWWLMAKLVPMAGEAAAVAGGAEVGGSAARTAGIIANSAGWIALRYMHVSFMPAIGISIAVTAIVGRCLGMNRPDLAVRRTYLGLVITMVYMGLCGLGFILFREWMILQFVAPGTSAETTRQLVATGSAIMIAAAVFQLFDAMAITVSGALRGAGDTVWPGVVTIVASWVCLIGIGRLMIAIAPQLGALGPWIGASAYIIVLGILFTGRFLGGKWKQIDLIRKGPPPPGTLTGPGEPLSAPADAIAGTTPGTV